MVKKRVWVSKNISSVAHPTRQAILRQLESGPKTTVDLERDLGESRYNLYYHLKTLTDEGYVRERVEGRVKVFELASDTTQVSDLSRDLQDIAGVQQAMASQLPTSRELEVKGEMLNQLLEMVGEERVAKNKRYHVMIVEKPSRSLKKR